MKGVDLTPDQIRQRIAELGEWFHNIDLRGIQTAPHHFLGDYPRFKWRRFENAIPADLRGMTVLDIGCNGGFYAIEMKRRGADRVVGIDSDESYLAQACFAAEVCNVDIELKRLSVYEIGRLKEKFDLVLFMGVLYHLRHPLLALDLIHEHVAGDTLVFQSMLRGADDDDPTIGDDAPITDTALFERAGYPRLHFVESRYAGDPTNWWIPNRACAVAMLRSAGFDVTATGEPEVFVCKRRALPDETQAAYATQRRLDGD
jgi:tRNA (mo5U34)-methyltransferase